MADQKPAASIRSLTIDQICELSGTSRVSAERAIARLIERGLIREVKEPAQ